MLQVLYKEMRKCLADAHNVRCGKKEEDRLAVPGLLQICTSSANAGTQLVSSNQRLTCVRVVDAAEGRLRGQHAGCHGVGHVALVVVPLPLGVVQWLPLPPPPGQVLLQPSKQSGDRHLCKSKM